MRIFNSEFLFFMSVIFIAMLFTSLVDGCLSVISSMS